MEFDKAPIPASTQWPEARGFLRVYSENPRHQARLVMALFGFRQDLIEWVHDEEAIKAIETVLRAFYERHPEFMQDGYKHPDDASLGAYRMDERLPSYMADIIDNPAKPLF